MPRLKHYAQLIKMGIGIHVGLTSLLGYLIGFPLENRFALSEVLQTVVGVFLLSSGASALNQLQEIPLDRRMTRTQSRPLPSGKIRLGEASALTALLLLLGSVLLYRTHWICLALGLLAVLSYNGLYTLWWKQRWAFAAIPGAVPGALPILIGYAAATQGSRMAGGIYLFALQFFWQMPHFWSLALKFREDYARGGIPTLPVHQGQDPTLLQIWLWALGYVGVSLLAPYFFATHGFYLAIAVLTGLKLLYELRRYAADPNGRSWIRFFIWVNFSLLIYITGIAVDLWSVYLLIPLLTR